MTPTLARRWSRRGLMYLIVGVQVLILGAIVASQEINRALDSSVPVDLEISQAQARKDPFRGASVSGQPALDLDGTNATVPAERFQPGERVLVFFAREPGRRPRITQVERRGWRADPLFGADNFSVPGRVQREGRARSFSGGGGGLVARVGKPPVRVELEVPASIPIEDASLEQLSGPSLIRASLRRGFLGHRYLTDVRLIGRGWTGEISFAYDQTRDRLIVLAPKQERFDPRRSSTDRQGRSEIFFFGGEGKEIGSAEVAGRLVEGAINPADGTLLGLLTKEAWGHSTVYLVRIGENGQIVQQGQQIEYERVVGVNAGEGAMWVLVGAPGSPLQPPFFVDSMTLAGLKGQRLGPFASKPRVVHTSGQQVWVVEPEQHRVTRLDRSTGRIEREYRDVNRPTDIAVDAGGLVLIEANQTQLSRFSHEGQLVWRIPRFQGLAWVIPDGASGGGWVGAQRFEGREGGVFRYEPDGKVTRVSGLVAPRVTSEWNRGRLAPEAIREARQGRVYIREGQAISILGGDGTLLKRIEGFRYKTEQRVRG